jgi:hypothetical protein
MRRKRGVEDGAPSSHRRRVAALLVLTSCRRFWKALLAVLGELRPQAALCSHQIAFVDQTLRDVSGVATFPCFSYAFVERMIAQERAAG